MLIDLYGLDGLHQVEIPNNVPLPPAIIWGNKVFVKNFLGAYHEYEAYVVATTGGPPSAGPVVGPS
jgi:hypothetical protein